MALLQYRHPVDYEAQQEAFREFLENFKSADSASEETAANTIERLNIDGDGTSDEYDFMDDAEDGETTTRRRNDQTRRDKRKYLSLLQDIADRVESNILIELDDLDVVRESRLSNFKLHADIYLSQSTSDLWATTIT